MSPAVQSALGSWSFRPGISLAVVLAAVLYLRGWRVLHHVAPDRFPGWRLWAFLAGLFALLAALVSPLDTFSGLLPEGEGVELARAASRAGGSLAGCKVFRKATRAVVSAGLRFFP